MKNKYSLIEFFSTGSAFILTKIFYKGARIIRRPFYIRGKASIGSIKKLTTGHHCRFDLPSGKVTLNFGENCQLGDNVHIVAHESVTFGNNVLCASKVFISDTSHGSYDGITHTDPLVAPDSRPLHYEAVVIGNNVWIGEHVCILKGVTIGDGAIIGANAVVTKNVASYTIAVGIPAKGVKKYNFESLRWERYVEDDKSNKKRV